MNYIKIGLLLSNLLALSSIIIILIKPLHLKVLKLIGFDFENNPYNTSYGELIFETYLNADNNAFTRAGFWILLIFFSLFFLFIACLMVVIVWPIIIMFFIVAVIFKISDKNKKNK